MTEYGMQCAWVNYSLMTMTCKRGGRKMAVLCILIFPFVVLAELMNMNGRGRK